jgi:hypothetical protein
MRITTMAKTKAIPPCSFADYILTLCATGRFGVREAIAAAKKRYSGKRKQLPKQNA